MTADTLILDDPEQLLYFGLGMAMQATDTESRHDTLGFLLGAIAYAIDKGLLDEDRLLEVADEHFGHLVPKDVV